MMEYIEAKTKHLRDMSGSYTDIAKIGQGTYGRVYRAKNEHHQRIAIKQLLRLDNEYSCMCAVREISILKTLNHENVIDLPDVCLWGNAGEAPRLSLALEYCAHDLHNLIHKGGEEDRFTYAAKKNIMSQILCGVDHIHSYNFVHRDLKPANILITEIGDVKIGDFGLARSTDTTTPDEPQESMTPDRFTSGYRPPEVLLGSWDYGTAADMWTVGFIFIELLFRQRFSQSWDDLEQLQDIVNLCGPIGTHIWPGVDSLPGYEDAMESLDNNKTPLLSTPSFKETFPDIFAFKFLRDLIPLNPSQRMTATDALEHEIFRQEPEPDVFLDYSKF